DLSTWLEQEVRSRAPSSRLITEATARMQSIRSELQARAARLRKRDADSAGNAAQPLDRALERRLSQSESQIVNALRHAKGSFVSLDPRMARYEDSIFEGLCALARVSPSVVRDVFAAHGPVPGEPGQPQAAGGQRASDGYFDLQSDFRRTQLDIRQLE